MIVIPEKAVNQEEQLKKTSSMTSVRPGRTDKELYKTYNIQTYTWVHEYSGKNKIAVQQ